MKEFDKKYKNTEPEWFSVFRIIDENGANDLMAIWGNRTELPLVTQLKFKNKGKTITKYCVGMARCLEERDAIVEKIRRHAEASNWEEEE